jgi:alpha-L-rhamnosidase
MSSMPPFPQSDTGNIFLRYHWPVSWITLPQAGVPPYVMGFRLVIDEPRDISLRCHVTGDERYELYLDGERIAGGPERCSAQAWHYETLDLSAKAGRHVLFARVSVLDVHGPYAQCSVRPGFLLGVEPVFQEEEAPALLARWGTGLAPWEARRMEGYEWVDELGLDILDGRHYPWGIERGECEGQRHGSHRASRRALSPSPAGARHVATHAAKAGANRPRPICRGCFAR